MKTPTLTASAITALTVAAFASPAAAQCVPDQIRAECRSVHGVACCNKSEIEMGTFCSAHGASKAMRIAKLQACSGKWAS
jgi:hypothetical protein